MDERVLGDMPSEGSEGRRFGIYRAHTHTHTSGADPKMFTVSRLRVLFVAAIAAVVSFAVFFPMIQFVSRINKKTVYYPYTELSNLSIFKNEEEVVNIPAMNCSSNIFSFGHDCSNDNTQTSLNSSENSLRNESDSTTLSPNDNNASINDTTTQLNLDEDDSSSIKSERIGRSRRPEVSTPYPYYNYIPKPTPSLTDRKFEDLSLPMTPIFAIPLDLSEETYADYRPQRPKKHFTPPPYAFTPLPNFTDRYAQLSPYKVPSNSTNVDEVMKFLNNKDNTEETMTTERILPGINSRISTMKVKGTYTMPLDDIEDSEETVTFYNGHAYISDPFVKFRPSHPLDINRLMPVNPRYRRPPHPVRDLHTIGSHTVAIFHPSSPSSPRPLSVAGPMSSSPKPLTVTLDIYPVTMDDQEKGSGPSTTFPGRERGRLNPNWRPRTTERPRWHRPHPPPRKPQDPDNHMVVHLNLFPNKRKPYNLLRRNKLESTTETEDRTTILAGGQFLARNSLEKPGDHVSTEAMDRTTTLPLTGVGIDRDFTIRVATASDNSARASTIESSEEENDDTITTITENLLPDDERQDTSSRSGEVVEYEGVDGDSREVNDLENVSMDGDYDLDYSTAGDATAQPEIAETEEGDYEIVTDSTGNEQPVESAV